MCTRSDGTMRDLTLELARQHAHYKEQGELIAKKLLCKLALDQFDVVNLADARVRVEVHHTVKAVPGLEFSSEHIIEALGSRTPKLQKRFILDVVSDPVCQPAYDPCCFCCQISCCLPCFLPLFLATRHRLRVSMTITLPQ